MRGAFVVQLGPETRPAESRFEGWVEEVDSCTDMRFRSSKELLNFLAQRFEIAMGLSEKGTKKRQKDQTATNQNNPCKGKKLLGRASGKSKQRSGDR